MVEMAQFVFDVNNIRAQTGQIALHEVEFSRYVLLDWKIKLLELKEPAAVNKKK